MIEMKASAVEATSNRFVFRSSWEVEAAIGRATEALEDIWSYPKWWPQFQSATQIDDDHGRFVVRGRLPFSLRFELKREPSDVVGGILRARVKGDISGTVEWRIQATSSQVTRVDLRQEVLFGPPWIGRVPFLKPVLEWNHRSAMRQGQQGLNTYLVGER